MRITDRTDTLPAAPEPAGRSRCRRAPARTRSRRGEMAMFVIGSLRDDVDALAASIARASACVTITVWIDDEYRVHCTCVDVLPSVPSHWIVGTYACGAELSDIAEDLRHERGERERTWRLD